MRRNFQTVNKEQRKWRESERESERERERKRERERENNFLTDWND